MKNEYLCHAVSIYAVVDKNIPSNYKDPCGMTNDIFFHFSFVIFHVSFIT